MVSGNHKNNLSVSQVSSSEFTGNHIESQDEEETSHFDFYVKECKLQVPQSEMISALNCQQLSNPFAQKIRDSNHDHFNENHFHRGQLKKTIYSPYSQLKQDTQLPNQDPAEKFLVTVLSPVGVPKRIRVSPNSLSLVNTKEEQNCEIGNVEQQYSNERSQLQEKDSKKKKEQTASSRNQKPKVTNHELILELSENYEASPSQIVGNSGGELKHLQKKKLIRFKRELKAREVRQLHQIMGGPQLQNSGLVDITEIKNCFTIRRCSQPIAFESPKRINRKDMFRQFQTLPSSPQNNNTIQQSLFSEFMPNKQITQKTVTEGASKQERNNTSDGVSDSISTSKISSASHQRSGQQTSLMRTEQDDIYKYSFYKQIAGKDNNNNIIQEVVAKDTLKKIGCLPDNSQDGLVLSELALKERAVTDHSTKETKLQIEPFDRLEHSYLATQTKLLRQRFSSSSSQQHSPSVPVPVKKPLLQKLQKVTLMMDNQELREKEKRTQQQQDCFFMRRMANLSNEFTSSKSRGQKARVLENKKTQQIEEKSFDFEGQILFPLRRLPLSSQMRVNKLLHSHQVKESSQEKIYLNELRDDKLSSKENQQQRKCLQVCLLRDNRVLSQMSLLKEKGLYSNQDLLEIIPIYIPLPKNVLIMQNCSTPPEFSCLPDLLQWLNERDPLKDPFRYVYDDQLNSIQSFFKLRESIQFLIVSPDRLPIDSFCLNPFFNLQQKLKQIKLKSASPQNFQFNSIRKNCLPSTAENKQILHPNPKQDTFITCEPQRRGSNSKSPYKSKQCLASVIINPQ